jgi:hypothetical protein
MLYWNVGFGTVRNNFFLFEVGGVGSVRPMNMYWFGPAAQPSIDDMDVYNNTSYSLETNTSVGSGEGFSMIAVDAQFGAGSTHPSTNVRVYNNLAYAPNFTTRQMVYDPYGSVGGNQADNTFVSTPSSTWVGSDGSGGGFPFTNGGTPPQPSYFKLRSSAPEVGTGTDVTVHQDFFGNYRDGVANDPGFHQYNAGTDPFGNGGGALLNRMHTEGLFVGA